MSEAIDAVVKELANLGWRGLQAVNTSLPETPSPAPDWAPGPLLKSRERTRPPLGWPRDTDSLCPRCVVETRNAILRGERDLADLLDGRVGEIKARIAEEDGRILIRKTCREHGAFEDVLSVDPEFSRVIESRASGTSRRRASDGSQPASGIVGGSAAAATEIQARATRETTVRSAPPFACTYGEGSPRIQCCCIDKLP